MADIKMKGRSRVSLVLTDDDGEMSVEINLSPQAVLLLSDMVIDLIDAAEEDPEAAPAGTVEEIDNAVTQAYDWVRKHGITQ